MRKVMVTSYENAPGTKQWVEVDKGEAVFHGFGTDHEEYESGPGNYPIAIVEFPDGHIETPRAERIRFLTPNAALTGAEPQAKRPG
jgi:hypothetical protein